jgi:inner membrane protein
VTPTPFNTLLWRVVVMRDGGFEEGFVSLLDGGRPIRFDRFASDAVLYEALSSQWAVQRMAWFSRGFFRLHEEGGSAFITDLRMGQEPNYSFSFRVAQRGSEFVPVTPQNQAWRGDVKRALAWLGPRMLGHDLPPPR